MACGCRGKKRKLPIKPPKVDTTQEVKDQRAKFGLNK
jgi:hypothetical protein